MKKWKCLICSYIHEGEIPPDICPVCGADKSKFILLDESEKKGENENNEQTMSSSDEKSTSASSEINSEEPGKENKKESFKKLYLLITKYHGHPITVHIPNGVLPFSVFFTLMAMLFGSSALCVAAKYNMIVVFISMPAVLFTGYVDWKNRFGGNMTKIFMGKMICGGLVTFFSFVISIWWLMNPTIAMGAFSENWIFILLNILIMMPAIFAGYLGGKLVFHYQD